MLQRKTRLKPKREKPRRNDGRIQHKRAKPKAKAPPSAAEHRHLDRIAAMPCVVTGRRPVVVHHVMRCPGKVRRRDHRFVTPLVPELHNFGPLSVHGLGSEVRFREVHGIDLAAWAITEWEVSCQLEGKRNA